MAMNVTQELGVHPAEKNVNWEQKQNIQDLFKPNEDFKRRIFKLRIAQKVMILPRIVLSNTCYL